MTIREEHRVPWAVHQALVNNPTATI